MNSSVSPVRCGERLVSALEALGVDTVFGIPGVHTQEIYRGLSRSGIRHVLARNEQGAGLMAAGYARATGCLHPDYGSGRHQRSYGSWPGLR
jgi:thiamine pyrophosphate-dependent acetolactate synthase large subunit-like protein